MSNFYLDSALEDGYFKGLITEKCNDSSLFSVHYHW